jgi:hypothetical protein
MRNQERRTLATEDTVKSQTVTLPANSAGDWEVGEVRETSTRKEGKNRSTEERVSRPDLEGKLGEVSHITSRESETASGERRATVETYSIDVPGTTRDGSLHLVERATTVERISSTGQQTTETQVE